MQKRLTPHQRVSGAVGDFIEGGHSKRRRRERWFGHVIQAVGERRYMVRFDNGQEKELPYWIITRRVMYLLTCFFKFHILIGKAKWQR